MVSPSEPPGRKALKGIDEKRVLERQHAAGERFSIIPGLHHDAPLRDHPPSIVIAVHEVN